MDMEILASANSTPDNNNVNLLKDTFTYLFSPILIITLILTITSNIFNIFLLAQTVRKSTSLNILLSNISSFNLLMVYNQVILLVLVLRRGSPIPKQLCHLATIINIGSSYGISFVHLLLSLDRYAVAKKPMCWIENRKKAWIASSILWIGISILAAYNLVFYFKDINGDIVTCFWPTSNSCGNAYSVALDILNLTVLVVIAILVYVFHKKTSIQLKKNEKMKERELNETSDIAVDKLPKTVSERAINCIETVFTVHFLTQLPYYTYNLIRHAISTRASPIAVIILTTISFITATSLLFLLCNRRYKQNVKTLFAWIWQGRENSDFGSDAPNEVRPPPSPTPAPKSFPNNRSIFFSGERSSNYSYTSKKSKPRKKARAHRNVSQISMTGGQKKSVNLAALNAGLVLSAAGHQIQLNNFFKEDSLSQGETVLAIFGE